MRLARPARRGARPRGPVPGLSIPGRDSGRQQCLPAEGGAERQAQNRRRTRGRCLRVPGAHQTKDEAHADERDLSHSRRERRFFRRREETQRSTADAGAGAEARDTRRDGFGPGYRRAEGGAGDPLPAIARLYRAGPGACALRRPHLEVGRSLARARAGAARLRLGDGEPSRMIAPQPHAPSAAQPAALRSFEAQWLERQSASKRLDRSTAGDPLSALREEAMGRFLRLGLPTTRDESWRYTNLRRLTAHSFIDAPDVAEESGAAAGSWDLGERLATVHMVNGFAMSPTPRGLNSKDIVIYNLRDLSRIDPDLVARLLPPLSDAEERALRCSTPPCSPTGCTSRCAANWPPRW